MQPVQRANRRRKLEVDLLKIVARQFPEVRSDIWRGRGLGVQGRSHPASRNQDDEKEYSCQKSALHSASLLLVTYTDTYCTAISVSASWSRRARISVSTPSGLGDVNG